MGSLTLSNMWDEVHLELLERTDFDPSNTEGKAQLTRWINFAYLHVSDPRIHRHKELQTQTDLSLVAGGDTVDLSTNLTRYWAIHHIYYVEQNRNLEPLSIRRLDSLGSKPDGPPSYYAIYGSTLHLDTEPTAAEAGDTLRVRYWQTPALFVSTVSTATTVLAEVWDQVIIQGATFYAWLGLGHAERADFQRESFGVLINEVGSRMQLEGEDEGFRVRPVVVDYQTRI